jgi:inosine triphosphate pyrophosphatase
MKKDPIKIEYITSNAQKFEEARHILSSWELEQVNIELTEIQGNRFEIAQAKAKEALRILNRPLVVEDVSMNCPAIGGLPGPYIKDFLKSIGDHGLVELIHKYEDHSVEVICVVGYIKPGIEPILFEGVVSGTIVKPRGLTKHGIYSWNGIVQPHNSSKTYGEMSLVEHSLCSMRFIALNKLKHFLENEKG